MRSQLFRMKGWLEWWTLLIAISALSFLLLLSHSLVNSSSREICKKNKFRLNSSAGVY